QAGGRAQRPRAQGPRRADGRGGGRPGAAPRHRPVGRPAGGQAAGRLDGRRPGVMSDRGPTAPPLWRDWIRRAEDPAGISAKPEALDDLLVLDCSVGHYGGHVLARFLGELGAEVVKLEPPRGHPAGGGGPAEATAGGDGLAFLAEGRNRAYAPLDLAHPEGQALLRQLAVRADVLIEGFPAGRMDGWGIGYRQLQPLNPRLVYVALST